LLIVIREQNDRLLKVLVFEQWVGQ